MIRQIEFYRDHDILIRVPNPNKSFQQFIANEATAIGQLTDKKDEIWKPNKDFALNTRIQFLEMIKTDYWSPNKPASAKDKDDLEYVDRYAPYCNRIVVMHE